MIVKIHIKITGRTNTHEIYKYARDELFKIGIGIPPRNILYSSLSPSTPNGNAAIIIDIIHNIAHIFQAVEIDNFKLYDNG